MDYKISSNFCTQGSSNSQKGTQYGFAGTRPSVRFVVAHRAEHARASPETPSVSGQRNDHACDLYRNSKPRGTTMPLRSARGGSRNAWYRSGAGVFPAAPQR